MNVCYIAHVSGKVQGVYYRVSCQQEAIDLGLSGYARNLADGDVEVLICGQQSQVDKMLEWLKDGPEQAEVSNVLQKQIPWQEHNHFSVE